MLIEKNSYSGNLSQSLHILMTVNASWNVWNFRRPLLDAFLADGHQVSVLAPSDDTTEELARSGCQVLPLTMDLKGLNPVQDYKLYRRFYAAFAQEKPDLILSYTVKNNIYGAFAAKRLGIPFLPTVTGLGTAFLSGMLLRGVAQGLFNEAFRNLPLICFQNSDDRDLFVSKGMIDPWQAQLVAGSGIDLQQFSAMKMPSPNGAPVFLMIARLLRDKGVLEFVKAARIVKQAWPKARFQLLGEAGAENRHSFSAATVAQWVSEGVVEYLGTTNDVRPHIQQADCVVLPSYREGAPRTLIEAAAMARPVIATDVPGCRAVVERDVSGYLCAPQSAESLAASVKRFLLLSPLHREEMGIAGRRKMEREFDQSRVVASYRSYLKALVSQQPLRWERSLA